MGFGSESVRAISEARSNCQFDIPRPWLFGLVDINAARSVFDNWECVPAELQIIIALKELFFGLVILAVIYSMYLVIYKGPEGLHEKYQSEWGAFISLLLQWIFIVWLNALIFVADVEELGNNGKNGYKFEREEGGANEGFIFLILFSSNVGVFFHLLLGVRLFTEWRDRKLLGERPAKFAGATGVPLLADSTQRIHDGQLFALTGVVAIAVNLYVSSAYRWYHGFLAFWAVVAGSGLFRVCFSECFDTLRCNEHRGGLAEKVLHPLISLPLRANLSYAEVSSMWDPPKGDPNDRTPGLLEAGGAEDESIEDADAGKDEDEDGKCDMAAAISLSSLYQDLSYPFARCVLIFGTQCCLMAYYYDALTPDVDFLTHSKLKAWVVATFMQLYAITVHSAGESFSAELPYWVGLLLVLFTQVS
jgi:hypothetical protein